MDAETHTDKAKWQSTFQKNTHTNYSTLNAISASMRKETYSAAVLHSGSIGEK